MPTGSKLWRFKYRFANKNKLLSFGSYPETSIAAARRKREEARTFVNNCRHISRKIQARPWRNPRFFSVLRIPRPLPVSFFTP
jgi:hypothetical protein